MQLRSLEDRNINENDYHFHLSLRLANYMRALDFSHGLASR